MCSTATKGCLTEGCPLCSNINDTSLGEYILLAAKNSPPPVTQENVEHLRQSILSDKEDKPCDLDKVYKL